MVEIKLIIGYSDGIFNIDTVLKCKSKFLKFIESEKITVKPFIEKFELLIKKYPLFSVLATIIFSVFINIFSNFIWYI